MPSKHQNPYVYKKKRREMNKQKVGFYQIF